MLASIIICTVRRPEVIRRVLDCLAVQTHPEMETLVVGPPQGLEVPADLAARPAVRFLSAPKGLAPARNAGLRRARGGIVFFLDDDVVFDSGFVAEAISIFERPGMSRLGGITAYDEANYGRPLPPRWRMRALLGLAPSLRPGDASDLGRSVPFTHAQPFHGCRAVKWLPGFCQIYRREAVQGLRYDEAVVVEDRDFSMQVGDRWELLFCGDLKIRHLQDDQARFDSPRQTWRAAFGLGRTLAKRKKSALGYFHAGHVLLGEFAIDVLALLRAPSLERCRMTIRRANGFVSGLASVYRHGN